MKRSQKRQMPTTPRNSVIGDALLDGSSGSTEPFTNNASRTQRRPKTRGIGPVGTPSSIVLRSASAALVASVDAQPATPRVARAPPVAASAPRVAAPVPPKATTARPVRRGLNPLASSSTISDSGIGSVTSPTGEASEGRSREEIRFTLHKGGSHRKRDTTNVPVGYNKETNDYVSERFKLSDRDVLEILFRRPEDYESPDDSSDSNERSEGEELESNNDPDSEAGGRGRGEGAVSVA